MSSPRRPEWYLPAAALLMAAVIGFGARNLWPRPASPAQPDAAVPVSVAHLVRTDVAQRQVVAGTLGYQGSYAVVNELPATQVAMPAGSSFTTA